MTRPPPSLSIVITALQKFPIQQTKPLDTHTLEIQKSQRGYHSKLAAPLYALSSLPIASSPLLKFGAEILHLPPAKILRTLYSCIHTLQRTSTQPPKYHRQSHLHTLQRSLLRKLSLPHSPKLLLQHTTFPTNQTLLRHVLFTHAFRSSRNITWLDYMSTLTIYHPPSTIGAVLVQRI
jgi:hypothetical protein